ncbi:MAG: hypothetical protein EU536_03695 [Promethearchaeota archaeon]|nr:MAG: hypothetical protein EU536_03695 [Candidatus Lokiarchaeota archaeon]
MSADLVQRLIGRECKAPPFKVDANHMREYATSLGVVDPKYAKVAFPAYAAAFVLPALWHWRKEISEYQELVKDPRYIVHGGQEYEFTDIEILSGDILTSTVQLADIFIKKNMLFLIYKIHTTNQNAQLLLTTTITVIVRPGGF